MKCLHPMKSMKFQWGTNFHAKKRGKQGDAHLTSKDLFDPGLAHRWLPWIGGGITAESLCPGEIITI